MRVKPKAIILIPARYESSRFPGKVLSLLQGKPLVQRVYENMLETHLEVAVVTDCGPIKNKLSQMGVKVIPMDGIFANGTERVGTAYRNLGEGDHSYVVSVQADEPLLTGQLVLDLLDFHARSSSSSFDVTTIVRSRKGGKGDFESPHVVKVRLGEGGVCHDFFRAPLGDVQSWHQHAGVYCYTVSALLRYCSTPQVAREKDEQLEQLRGLECGFRYGAMVVPESVSLKGVDTQESLLAVQEILDGRS